MPVVILKGHDHVYPVSDILRSFYGEVCENGGSIIAGTDVTEIISESDGEYIRTICEARIIEKRVFDESGSRIVTPKREIKKQLYQILTELTGRSLPFGSLTGIRPTLMAVECDYNTERLTGTYYLAPEKARLTVETARKENRILDSIPNDSIHIYVSVPVCPSRCDYCSFPTSDYSTSEHLMEEYIEILITELKLFTDYSDRYKGSIYIGGGTPTVLNDDVFGDLLSAVSEIARSSGASEFTVEAGRPDTITESKIALMKKYGVTRVCVNPQSFNDSTLRRIGRRHSAGDTAEVYHSVREAGFRTVNMDLIAGLCGETREDFLNSLSTAVSLGPENITIHSLSLKRTSPMRKRFTDNNGSTDFTGFLSEDIGIAEMLEEGYNTLAASDYKPYYMYRQKYTLGGNENTGYSLEGHECIYNCAMIGDRHSVLGIGAKSISKKVTEDEGIRKIERYQNPADIEIYIRNSSANFLKKREFFK